MDRRQILKDKKHVWILSLLFVQLSTGVETKPCANFYFPTLDDFMLVGNENTTVSIPFTVKYENKSCLSSKRFSLQVARKTSYVALRCSFVLINGECQKSSAVSKCTCSPEIAMYYLNHTLSREDNSPTVWIWSTNSGIIQERRLIFRVHYPAEVTHLEVGSSQPADQMSPVNVTCFWNQGHPPVSVYLLDRHSEILATSNDSSGQILYRFPAVGCQDAGLIRCEAPGASQNMTTTLLVNCTSDTTLQDQTLAISTAVVNHISATSAASSGGSLSDHMSVDVTVAIAGGIVLFLLLNVTVSIVCVVKARRNIPHHPPVQEPTVHARESLSLDEHVSGQSVHVYFEVPDSPPPSDEEDVVDELPPSRCHGPSNPPADYLKPTASQEEAEEEGAEWKVVRLYENTELRPVGPAATGASRMQQETECSFDLADGIESGDFLPAENIDTEETEYVKYSPPLYENTM